MSELFNLWDKLFTAPSSCFALEEELGIKASASCELSKCSTTGPYTLALQPHSSWHAWKEPAISPRIFLGISLFSHLAHRIFNQPPPDWCLYIYESINFWFRDENVLDWNIIPQTSAFPKRWLWLCCLVPHKIIPVRIHCTSTTNQPCYLYASSIALPQTPLGSFNKGHQVFRHLHRSLAQNFRTESVVPGKKHSLVSSKLSWRDCSALPGSE